MKNPDKRAYYRREFLNGGDGMAALEAIVNKSDGYGVFADFTISDCVRTVTIDFTCYDETMIPGRLDKLDLIISALLAFREAFNAETADMAAARMERRDVPPDDPEDQS